MKTIDVTRRFQTDDQCLDYIEKMRWPNGEIGCVHCGEVGRVSKITREKAGKNKRTRLYQCLACGKQFSATRPALQHLILEFIGVRDAVNALLQCILTRCRHRTTTNTRCSRAEFVGV